MLWNEVIELATGTVAEPTSDADYFKRSNMAFVGAISQHTASKKLRTLEYNDDGYEISLVRGQILYDLPVDCLGIEKVRFNTDWFLNFREKRPAATPDLNSYPVNYWIHGKSKVGVYPPPSSINALTLEHTGIGTAATVANDGTALTITITGVGAYPYTLATYATVTLLVAAINGDTATSGVTATENSGTSDPTDLEIVSATDIYESDTNLYMNCVDSLYIWGKRSSPTYAFRVKHDDTASPTSVTYTVDATNFSVVTTGSQAIIITHDPGATGVTAATVQVTATSLITVATGGTGTTKTYLFSGYATMATLAGAISGDVATQGFTATVVHEEATTNLAVRAATNCFDKSLTILCGEVTTSLALATYTTAGTLITAINAAGVHCTAIIGETCPTGSLTADLEYISGYDILDTNRRVMFNPELEDDELRDIVVNDIMAELKQQDKSYNEANAHRQLSLMGTETHKVLNFNRKIEHGNIAIQDANDDGFNNLGERDEWH